MDDQQPPPPLAVVGDEGGLGHEGELSRSLATSLLANGNGKSRH